MTSTSPVAAMFDRAADDYDRTGVEMFGPIAELLVRELDPQPGERALDVGCGRGAALIRLGRATGTTVTGVDLAPRMVAAARQDAAAAGIDAVVRLGDAQAPDVDGAPFDIVASSLVVFFLPDPLAALRTWRELLVPGGRLGVTTFGPTCDLWLAVDDVFAPHLPAGATERRRRARSGPFESDEGVEDLLAEAGLVDVRTVTDVVQVRFDDEDQWVRWSWAGGFRGMWESVPEEQRPDVERDARAMLQGFRGPDGRIGFDQPVRATLARR